MEKYKFYQNKECPYFPCHKDIPIEEFSCLFCFCPWYYHCGSKKESNDCKDCSFPHDPRQYDTIIKGIQNIHQSLEKNEVKPGTKYQGILNQGACAKQVVVAIIKNNNKYWIGTNKCRTPQKICPRGYLPPGEGYDICKNVCHQDAHAEINALKDAGEEAKGGILYLIGNNRICKECAAALKKSEIKEAYIITNGGITKWEL